jgi:hypothetical protein
MHTEFSLENLKVRDQSEDLGADVKHNIRMDLREIVWEVSDCMHLAQNKD